MKKYSIGLSATFHDPAISIVDQQGKIVFAEAIERPLQYKRAFNCPSGLMFYFRKVILKYCTPKSQFIICINWGKKHPFKHQL